MNKIILFIATSQDGYIADEQGGVDWLPAPKNEDELREVGYLGLLEQVDTILMGRKSFDQALGFGEWAWPDQHTYIFTFQKLTSSLDCAEYTNKSPSEVIAKLKSRQNSKDVWLFGGAALAQSCEQSHLIDLIILTVTPHVFGKGTPLGLNLDQYHLKSERNLFDGMIQRVYRSWARDE